MSNVVLPEAFLKCVDPEDRKRLRLGMTAEEFMAAGREKNERELSKQIVALLRLKGIEPIVSATHRRATNNVGTPDVLFAVGGQATAWELKTPTGKLRPEQEQMAVRLQSPPNQWRWRLIRSVEQARAELKEMGL